jgi:hypothetical protein
VGKPEGKKPPGRPRCRWEDNIKTDLREIVWYDMSWIDLVRDRDHGDEPPGSMKCWGS